MKLTPQVDLLIKQGATFRLQFSFKTPLGDAVSFVGYTARMHMRQNHSFPTVLLELNTENGGIVLGGLLGTVNLYISDSDTSGLAVTSGVYDIKIISPNGDAYRLVEGVIAVSPGATR